MNKFLIILQVLLMVTAINAKEFLVANIASDGVSEGQAKMVSNALRSHLMRESKGDMVPAGVVTGKQGAETTTDAAKLVSLGKDLEANVVVGGTISAKGNDFTLKLSLYNVSTSDKMGDITVETADGFGGVMTKVLPDAAKKIALKDVVGGAPAPVVEEPKAPAEISFTVNSTPLGAKVLINDEEKGVTPYKLTIAPDMYKLTVSKDGFEFQDQVISVEDGMDDVNVTLAPIVAEVVEDTTEALPEVVSSGAGEKTNAVIGTQPEGAEISLDGEFIGFSNLLYETTTGTHEISIVMEGYRDTTFTKDFTGENNILDIPLFADKISEDFEEASKGITTNTIVRISTAVVSLGSLVGGIVLNSQIGTLNDEYEKEDNPAEAERLGDEIRGKQTTRNILYGVAGASAVGFGATFFF